MQQLQSKKRAQIEIDLSHVKKPHWLTLPEGELFLTLSRIQAQLAERNFIIPAHFVGCACVILAEIIDDKSSDNSCSEKEEKQALDVEFSDFALRG
jgi:hypothetical protein